MAVDEPRFLGRAVDYASFPTVDPAECVDEAEQRRQTDDAHVRWRRELQREWGAARLSILDAVEGFKSSGRLDRRLVSDVHLLERGVRRIDHDVGLGQ